MQGIKHFFEPPPVDTSQLCINGIGIREGMRAGDIDRPRGTGDFLFMYFHQPVWINHEPAPAERMCIWKPGQAQHYAFRDGDWIHSWIHMTGSRVSQLVRQAKLPTGEAVGPLPATLIDDALTEIYAEVTRLPRPNKTIVENLLENWLLRIVRSLGETPHASSPPDRFIDVRQFMDLHFDQVIRLDELAAMVHLSVAQFCDRFKHYFEVSPIEYVIQRRMSQATYLLHDRNLPIGRVAQLVGYEDVYHFSKLFKKRMGQSPRHWRQQILGI